MLLLFHKSLSPTHSYFHTWPKAVHLRLHYTCLTTNNIATAFRQTMIDLQLQFPHQMQFVCHILNSSSFSTTKHQISKPLHVTQQGYIYASMCHLVRLCVNGNVTCTHILNTMLTVDYVHLVCWSGTANILGPYKHGLESDILSWLYCRWQYKHHLYLWT